MMKSKVATKSLVVVGSRQSANQPALAEQRQVSVDVFENDNRFR